MGLLEQWIIGHGQLGAWVGINVLLALSVAIALFAGMVNLSGGGLFIAGSVAVVLPALFGWPAWTGLLVATAVATVLGVPLAIITQHAPPSTAAAASAVYGLLLSAGGLLIVGYLPAANGGQQVWSPSWWVLVLLLVCVLAVLWRAERSWLGKVLALSYRDPVLAGSYGINVAGSRFATLCLSCGMAGCAGALSLGYGTGPSSLAASFRQGIAGVEFALVGWAAGFAAVALVALLLTGGPALAQALMGNVTVVTPVVSMQLLAVSQVAAAVAILVALTAFPDGVLGTKAVWLRRVRIASRQEPDPLTGRKRGDEAAGSDRVLVAKAGGQHPNGKRT